MAKTFSPRVVGLFVIASVALGVVAAAYLGAGRILQRRVPFVVVFSEDLAGLEVDAPVKFRGVPAGRVASIHLSMGSTTEPLRELRMPVVIELNQTRIQQLGGQIDLSDKRAVRTLVEHGLRARLALESFLSNRRYVALDILPNAPPPKPSPIALPYPEIPVYAEPGLAALQADASKLLTKLQSIDFDGLVSDLRRAATSFERAANGMNAAMAGVPRTLRAADEAIASIGSAARTVEGSVAPIAADTRAAVIQLRAALEKAEGAIGKMNELVDPASPVAWQLTRTLAELERTSRSLRSVADEVDDDPSILVRGRTEERR